ncbi:high affinity immunoglobulin epsilon receptor subunit gamma-like [Erythrolamprus reginae]|uniref:high affinity immunoglobulin epsilon receptor subunit gamma-like n=1 Tax=Erythrolamprus reginae TaxID=121349 RepID=UPI00396C3C2D
MGPEALEEPQLCYVLDGILFLYGMVLTVLYCRLKGLEVQEMDHYSTLEASKAPPEGLPPRKTSSEE